MSRPRSQKQAAAPGRKWIHVKELLTGCMKQDRVVLLRRIKEVYIMRQDFDAAVKFRAMQVIAQHAAERRAKS